MPVADGQDWDGLLVLAAGVPWGGPWMSEKRLALALCRHVPVLYVDPPRSVLTHLRRPDLDASAPNGVTVERPGLARITPRALPGVSRPVLRTRHSGLRLSYVPVARRDWGGAPAGWRRW